MFACSEAAGAGSALYCESTIGLLLFLWYRPLRELDAVRWVLVFTTMLLLLVSSPSQGQDVRRHTMSEELIFQVCASGRVEGSYIAELESIGRVRLNIVCTGTGRAVASIQDQGLGAISYTMNYSEVTERQIRFYSFSLEPYDSLLVGTGNPGLQLHLDKNLLLQGKVEGHFKALNQPFPLKIHSLQTSSAPKIAKAENIVLPAGGFPEGIFETRPGPNHYILGLDLIGGRMRATLHIQDNVTAVVLFDGLEERDYPQISNTSGYSRGGTGRIRLYHIRGRFIDPDNIEFYLITMEHGFQGPFAATRVTRNTVRGWR